MKNKKNLKVYQKPTNQSIDSEITSSRSPLYDKFQFNQFNPDRLYQKKGNYDIYDEMRRDDQVKSVLAIKKSIALNSGWTIDIDESIAIHEEIKEKLETWLRDDIEISFEHSLLEMLTNLDYGVSFTEPVWKIEDQNIKLKYLKVRAPHSFYIHTDDAGNITQLEQSTQEQGPILIDINKIIVFPYQMEFGNWYGTSDLNAAYKSWWSKDIIIKFWNIFLEKWGSPLIIGRYDSNVTSQSDKNALDTILNRVQNATSIRLPKDIELELLEVKRSGEAGFDKAIDKYNMMIARSMGAPDLLGIGGSETTGGAFALGQKHFELFYLIIERIRQDLTLIVNRRIIKPLIDFNWIIGDVPYPGFTLNPLDTEQKVELLKVWIELVKGTGVKPTEEEINWARRAVNAPEGEVEFKAVNTGFPFGGGQNAEPKPDTPKQVPTNQKDNPEAVQEQEDKQMTKTYIRTPFMAEKKVDFKKIDKDLKNLENRHLERLSGAIGVIQESLIETVEKGKIIENKRVDKIKGLTLKNTNNFKLSSRRMLRDFYGLGLNDAKDLINQKQFIEIGLKEVLSEIINTAPVFITNIVTEDILNKAKLSLTNSVTQGTALKQAIKELNKIFEPYDPSFNGARLENIVRTNGLKAYNQTKQAFFAPFEKSGDIVAYQYSAILDDRTTSFCETHNGKIYALGSYISEIEPPNHFQCRSTLIPITDIELQDKSILGATREQNKEIFPEGKFKESKTFADKFEKKPGGFFVERKP